MPLVSYVGVSESLARPTRLVVLCDGDVDYRGCSSRGNLQHYVELEPRLGPGFASHQQRLDNAKEAERFGRIRSRSAGFGI